MNCFPMDQSLSDFLYSTKSYCNGSQWSTLAGNSALLPSDIIVLALLHAQRILAGNSIIVRCHVTLK